MTASCGEWLAKRKDSSTTMATWRTMRRNKDRHLWQSSSKTIIRLGFDRRWPTMRDHDDSPTRIDNAAGRKRGGWARVARVSLEWLKEEDGWIVSCFPRSIFLKKENNNIKLLIFSFLFLYFFPNKNLHSLPLHLKFTKFPLKIQYSLSFQSNHLFSHHNIPNLK